MSATPLRTSWFLFKVGTAQDQNPVRSERIACPTLRLRTVVLVGAPTVIVTCARATSANSLKGSLSSLLLRSPGFLVSLLCTALPRVQQRHSCYRPRTFVCCPFAGLWVNPEQVAFSDLLVAGSASRPARRKLQEPPLQWPRLANRNRPRHPFLNRFVSHRKAPLQLPCCCGGRSN